MSALDLHKLEIFRCVATLGSFSRAAGALFLTQSAVSQQIAAMERALGVPLFSRSARGVTLTTAGASLLVHADDILSRLAQAELDISAQRDGGQQHIAISATTGIGAFLTPTWLHAFRQQRPEIITTLHSCVLPVVITELQRGPIDLAFAESEPEALNRFDDLRTFALGQVRYVACVGPGHTWWGRERVSLRDFAGVECILREPECNTRKWMDALLANHQAKPLVVGQYDTFEAIKNGLRFGAHAALLPEYSVRGEHSAGSLWAIDVDEETRRPFYLVLKADTQLSTAATQLIDFVCAQFSAAAPEVQAYLRTTAARKAHQ
jgi:DNA-binding transcriptional LysR family regulator